MQILFPGQVIPRHSLMFVSHLVPSYPTWQSHSKSVALSEVPERHRPPFWQGLLAQGSKSSLQVGPIKAGGQLQVYPLMPSKQVPPLTQGLDLHSSTLVSQKAPSNPGRHKHWNVPGSLMQVAPFWQGLDWQSSMFSSQFLPVHPGWHWQL